MTFLIIAFMRSGSVRTIALICSAAVFGVFLIFHVRRRLVVEGGVFSYLPTFGRSRAFRLADIAGMTIGTNGRRLVGQDGRTLARFEDNQENSAILLQYLSEHGVGLLVK